MRIVNRHYINRKSDTYIPLDRANGAGILDIVEEDGHLCVYTLENVGEHRASEHIEIVIMPYVTGEVVSTGQHIRTMRLHDGSLIHYFGRVDVVED